MEFPISGGLVDAVSYVATGCTILLFCSPAPTIRKIVEMGSVGKFDSKTYLTSFLQCSLWFAYSLVTPNRFACLLTNTFGVSLSLLWYLVYLRYSDHKLSLLLQLLAAMVLVVVICCLDTLWFNKLPLKPFDSGEYLETEGLGMACVVCNILMYASPLSVARDVVRTRSVESMPLPISLMTFLVSSLWGTFGVLIADSWITMPNICGVLLGASQLALYGLIWSRPKKDPNPKLPI